MEEADVGADGRCGSGLGSPWLSPAGVRTRLEFGFGLGCCSLWCFVCAVLVCTCFRLGVLRSDVEVEVGAPATYLTGSLCCTLLTLLLRSCPMLAGWCFRGHRPVFVLDLHTLRLFFVLLLYSTYLAMLEECMWKHVCLSLRSSEDLDGTTRIGAGSDIRPSTVSLT